MNTTGCIALQSTNQENDYDDQIQIIKQQDKELQAKDDEIIQLRIKLNEMQEKLLETQSILLNFSTQLCTSINTEMNELIAEQSQREKPRGFFSFIKPSQNNRKFIQTIKQC